MMERGRVRLKNGDIIRIVNNNENLLGFKKGK